MRHPVSSLDDHPSHESDMQAAQSSRMTTARLSLSLQQHILEWNMTRSFGVQAFLTLHASASVVVLQLFCMRLLTHAIQTRSAHNQHFFFKSIFLIRQNAMRNRLFFCFTSIKI